MKSDNIINIFDKRLKKINKHFSKLPEDFEVEDIRSFRLEMKKLRAFIQLINTGNKIHIKYIK